MMSCQYSCHACDETAACAKCDWPFCNACSAGAYQYQATSVLCGDEQTLDSQLGFGDCPEQQDDLRQNGRYSCYVSVDQDGSCEGPFVFDGNDRKIEIGQEYVDAGYVGLSLGAISNKT